MSTEPGRDTTPGIREDWATYLGALGQLHSVRAGAGAADAAAAAEIDRDLAASEGFRARLEQLDQDVTALVSDLGRIGAGALAAHGHTSHIAGRATGGSAAGEVGGAPTGPTGRGAVDSALAEAEQALTRTRELAALPRLLPQVRHPLIRAAAVYAAWSTPNMLWNVFLWVWWNTAGQDPLGHDKTYVILWDLAGAPIATLVVGLATLWYFSGPAQSSSGTSGHHSVVKGFWLAPSLTWITSVIPVLALEQTVTFFRS